MLSSTMAATSARARWYCMWEDDSAQAKEDYSARTWGDNPIHLGKRVLASCSVVLLWRSADTGCSKPKEIVNAASFAGKGVSLYLSLDGTDSVLSDPFGLGFAGLGGTGKRFGDGCFGVVYREIHGSVAHWRYGWRRCMLEGLLLLRSFQSLQAHLPTWSRATSAQFHLPRHVVYLQYAARADIDQCALDGFHLGFAIWRSSRDTYAGHAVPMTLEIWNQATASWNCDEAGFGDVMVNRVLMSRWVDRHVL